MDTTRRDVIRTGLALAALPSGQALARPAALTDAACSRLKDARVQIAWNGAAADIRVAHSPDGPYATLLARDAKERWTGPVPVSPRPYFRLSSLAGVTETAERLLPLQGGRNFRDLGGYRTADGRMVRWGQLYRSGSMTHLTDADYGYLGRLGIKVICDFRTTAERTTEPTNWPEPLAPQMFSRDYAMPMSNVLAGPSGGDPTAASVRAGLINLYKTMPYDHADSYRRMFAELIAGRSPLAFNCSAGKDRTGVAAALLLTTLGVPHDQVLADYALTEKVVDYEALARNTSGPPAAGFEIIGKLSPEVRAPLLRSDPAYLQAAFDAVKEREGSIANFMRDRLGVSSGDVMTLRGRYLKKV
jgi:protein-tyrosine phosphatase